jgi:type II secretory pathway pseudopilin PulG
MNTAARTIKLSWMTLIEVLITIVVFSVGILTILGVITGSLTLGSRSRNRTTATMLAKEWLEMMYNIRDTNLDKAQKWGCMDITCTINIGDPTVALGTTYTFTIEGTWVNGITIINNPTFAARRLYLATWANNVTYYTHNATFPATQFYRYITISDTVDLWNSNQSFVNSQIKKIISTIEYPQLWWTGKIEFESFIGLIR